LETDVLVLAHVRYTGVSHRDDAHVSAELVDGLDGMEAGYRHISGRLGVSGIDNTGSALAS
jgi:hypothetical protein